MKHKSNINGEITMKNVIGSIELSSIFIQYTDINEGVKYNENYCY